MLSLLFLNVHADSPKPTSQDCPGSHGTSGNLGARIFFRKQGFISFICFQKTPPFWNKHCWNQRLWNFDLSWQIWTPKQSCERLWNTIGLARIFSTREVNVVEICKCEEENWFHASKGAAYSRHRVSVHSSEWVREWGRQVSWLPPPPTIRCFPSFYHITFKFDHFGLMWEKFTFVRLISDSARLARFRIRRQPLPFWLILPLGLWFVSSKGHELNIKHHKTENS